MKAVLDAFFKNSNATAEDIWNLRTNGFYCVYILGLYMLLIDSYIWLKIFRLRLRKHQSQSTFNAQLSWLKTIATLYTSFYLEPLRLLKIFVRHLSLIVSSLFEASKVSSWNILCMYCVYDLLFAFLHSLFFSPGLP